MICGSCGKEFPALFHEPADQIGECFECSMKREQKDRKKAEIRKLAGQIAIAHASRFEVKPLETSEIALGCVRLATEIINLTE